MAFCRFAAHTLTRGDAMAYAVIGENETAEQLSARLNRPVCMLLRANQLFSAAWLLPGREIIVPPKDFCLRDAGMCPVAALSIAAERFGRADDADEMPVPQRLQKWAKTHGNAALAEWMSGGTIGSLRPLESMAQFARRMGCGEAELRRINRYYGRPVPGVRLLIPEIGRFNPAE